MRVLADENVDPKYVVVLQGEGHDVKRVRDAIETGATDEEVLEYCRRESRVLLTNDKTDFSGLDPDDHEGVLVLTAQDPPPRELARAVNRIDEVVPPDSLSDLVLYVPDGWT